MVEHSETSDNRAFITSDISPETTPEEQTSNVEFQYTKHSVQSEQEDLANLFQNPEPHQVHQVSDLQQASPSETATVQKTSEFSEETIQNTQSFTITNDSNLINPQYHTSSYPQYHTRRN